VSIARVKASSLTQGLPKQKTMLAGNSTILPGSYESIQTVTVGAGGSASITFSSIPSTYTHLQIRAIARNNDSSGGLSFMRAKLNSDSTSGNYRGHYLYGSGSSASAGDVAGASSGLPCGYSAGNTNTASTFAATVLDILDYANTSKNKTTRALTGADFNDTSGGLTFVSGLYMITNAISSIEIVSSVGTGFVQHSSFALYGIR
jgi:hypothetical protein